MKRIRGLVLTAAFALLAANGAAIWPAAAAEPSGAPQDGPAAADPDPSRQDAESEAAEPVEVLLDRLSQAGSEREAKALEREIVLAWNRSGSDTVDLLLSRAGAAIKQEDYGLALQYLDAIVETRPDFPEAWNMRATVYYLLDEYELSIADIQHVLTLQPRHFGALSGLGMIFRDLDQPAQALDAFRQALAVHPYFGNVRESAEKLEPEVEGREI
ncbi:tetratricopeptide repeat protein [Microbaculum marinum]|uniref:Tetratricopeptide repeat protein n=1 Tax=Microbaculum marinum TaxID=1764581 RepID=A0AAW9RJI1_9HYPH